MSATPEHGGLSEAEVGVGEHLCDNYEAPLTCLTAPSSESARCDQCKAAVPDPTVEVLRARVEALERKWSGCWCETQMAYDHDPRVRDCPQHGDASCRHMAEGITSDASERGVA